MSIAVSLAAVHLIAWKLDKHISYPFYGKDHEDEASVFFYEHIGASPLLSRTDISLRSIKDSLKRPLSADAVHGPDGGQAGGGTDESLVAKYTVKILYTSTLMEAERTIHALNDAGLPAFLTPVSLEGKKTYRVTMGIFRQHHEAVAAVQTLKTRTHLEGEVIRLSPGGAASEGGDKEPEMNRSLAGEMPKDVGGVQQGPQSQ